MRSWSLFILVFLSFTGAYAQSFSDNFDASSFKSAWVKEGSNVALSTSQKLSGTRSFRAYLPAKTYSNARSELRFEGGEGVPKWQTLLTTWGVSVAVYVPTDFQPDNTSADIIMQYHGLPDNHDTYLNPPVAIQLVGSKLRLIARWIKRDPGTPSDQVTKTYDMVDVTPGKWHFFALDVNWDYRSNGNGSVKVYMRKGSAPTSSDLIGYHNGPVGSKDNLGPYFKLGIYKWDWKKSDRVAKSISAGVTKRELFFDNIRIQKGAIIGGSGGGSNNPPTVSVSGSSIITMPTNNVTLTANGSDTDGSISSYSWTKVSGPSATLSGKSSSRLSVTNMIAGTYQFRVTVKDNNGASASSTKTVEVRASGSGGNIPPTVSAGNDKTLKSGSYASFTATASDPDGSIASYKWTKVSGPSVSLSKTNESRMVVNLPQDGTYTFRVTVTDNKGASASDNVKLIIGDGGSGGGNEPPTVSAGTDKSLNSGSYASFTATASDPDGSIASYKWTKVSGPSVSLSKTNEARMVVNLPQDGTYNFRVTVTDNEGATASDDVKLVIGGGSSSGNKAPTVSAGNDKSLKSGSYASFTATASDSDGTVESYKWTKVSGPSVSLSKTNEERMVVNLPQDGTYVFRITVTDNDGATASDDVRLQIGITSGRNTSADQIVGIPVRNFSTKTDSIKLIDSDAAKLKVDLKNVNGVKVSIDDFNGELNTEVLRHGMYQYNVVGENGITLQKGTILIY